MKREIRRSPTGRDTGTGRRRACRGDAGRRPTVTVVSHTARRSGAAIVLRDLLDAKMLGDCDLTVVLLEDGPLRSDFERLGVTVVRPISPPYKARRVLEVLPAPVARLFGSTITWTVHRRLRHAIGTPDLLYLNTVASAYVLPLVDSPQTVTVVHVHEMAHALDVHSEGTEATRGAGHIIAVSEPVRDELLARGIDAARVSVVHEAIPTSDFPKTTPMERAEARNRLGIDPDAFVVLGIGTIERRKGADLFVEAAAIVGQRLDRARFMWAGSTGDAAFGGKVSQTSDESQARVIFLGEVESPMSAYRAADVFLLSSREDPFPLVCLEAAATGLPVIAAEASGGMASFVQDDAGLLVAEPTSALFAGAVHNLEADEWRRRELGNRAASKVRQRHDVGEAARRIRKILLVDAMSEGGLHAPERVESPE